MQRSGVLLFPDGAYRLTAEPLAQQSVYAALSRCMEGAYKRIGAAFTLDRQPVALAVSSQDALIGTRLTQLKLNSHFLLFEGSLVPLWAGGGLSLPMTCTWVPPDDCQLYFGVKAKVLAVAEGAVAVQKWKLHEAYFFAKSVSAGGFFKLPLPNLFNDGRICMGNSLGAAYANVTLEGLLKALLAHLSESPWGTDMSPDTLRTRQLFRFHPSTLTNIAIEGEWHANCQRVNRIELETLVPNGGTGL